MRSNASFAEPARAALRIAVRGVVQGVGFRPWVVREARALGLGGRVWNDAGGSVLEACGAEPALRELVRRIERCPLPGAQLTLVEATARAWSPETEFTIARSSAAAAAGALPLAPDLAACAECLAEVRDPRARRWRHPFAACAGCGPRYAVATALPYDREHTTLAAFPLCPDCRDEYEDPGDRRFHAQATACPRCGPQLSALGSEGAPRAHGEAALTAAVAALRAGAIVAIRGVGGFHLACDATREDAVLALRARKRRERRPLAVLVADLAAAEKLAELGAAERALLASPAAPIVLARLREDAPLAASVAPGLDRVGLLLPYTPLHLLLVEGAGFPLVMTSGNRSGEPIAWRAEDALARLGGIADLFLVHDRAIAAPCDDSVALVAGGAPLWIRRSRGRVPRPIRLAKPVERPTLGCGAHLHATVCLAVGDQVFPSAHLGDLDSPEALDAFEAAIGRLEALAGVRAERVAHDLHPGYASTRWARERAGGEAIGVQHHHAHLAAVLADAGVAGPAFGLTWDGTGWGPDGSAWGGELLLGDAAGCARLATLRPLQLAGGEAAIREPWRAALAALEDAFDGEPPLAALPLFAALDPGRVAAVRGLLRSGAGCVAAHGAGRWFDAIGALALACPRAGYSGELALAWNAAARGRSGAPYPFTLDRDRTPWQVDLRATTRAVVADLLAGAAPAAISGRFHETLAAIAEALLAAARGTHGAAPVALSGGCFQNPLLVERVAARLERLGLAVVRHREVPPGDGGIALGQVVAADALARARG
jgi:hydrogenase maturation protein HypF